MAESIVAMAKELVMALIKEELIAPEDMQKELQATHASLLALKAIEEQDGAGSGVKSERLTASQGDWKKSIKKHTVECLVCGQLFSGY